MSNINDGDPQREGGAEVPNAHTLTLLFHRCLDEDEWRAVVTAARAVPFIREMVAQAVVETPEELGRGPDGYQA